MLLMWELWSRVLSLSTSPIFLKRSVSLKAKSSSFEHTKSSKHTNPPNPPSDLRSAGITLYLPTYHRLSFLYLQAAIIRQVIYWHLQLLLPFSSCPTETAILREIHGLPVPKPAALLSSCVPNWPTLPPIPSKFWFFSPCTVSLLKRWTSSYFWAHLQCTHYSFLGPMSMNLTTLGTSLI